MKFPHTLNREPFLVIIFCWLVVSIFYCQALTAQESELAERLESLSQNAPPETVYVQTSKDIYETGEDLWFKAYVLNSRFLAPSGLSKTLYLQLLGNLTTNLTGRRNTRFGTVSRTDTCTSIIRCPKGTIFWQLTRHIHF